MESTDYRKVQPKRFAPRSQRETAEGKFWRRLRFLEFEKQVRQWFNVIYYILFTLHRRFVLKTPSLDAWVGMLFFSFGADGQAQHSSARYIQSICINIYYVVWTGEPRALLLRSTLQICRHCVHQSSPVRCKAEPSKDNIPIQGHRVWGHITIRW